MSHALATTLDTIADLLEIRGDGPAAAALRSAVVPLRSLPATEASAAFDGAAPDRFSLEVRQRVHQIEVAGDEAAVRGARAGVPQLVRRLLEMGVVSTHEAVRLVRQIGVATLADLETALDDGRIAQLAGGLEGRLAAATVVLAGEVRRVPLGRALDLLHGAAETVARGTAAIDALVPAGDVRRFEQLVGALVLVGRAADPAAAIDALARTPGVGDVRHRTGRRAICLMQQAEIDIRIAAPDEYGTVLFASTGSRAHLRGVHQRRGRPHLSPAEEAVYAHAGLPYIPPELREGTGELEAAAAGQLPALVERRHIRGDLHMHTTRSDGADTLDAMVGTCAALGYEYIAITDHSERAAAARTLTKRDLARQRVEIDAIRERYPQLRILHGIEVDIMPDGRLDFEEAVLETLDIVLASLHDAAGHDGRALTRRCLAAIRHPLVNVITHPANQLVGRRAGYPLDFEAVFAAAAETGTALEVDGAPSHLDLDGEHARRAVAAGVTLTIDSDCHRAAALDRQMALGIGTARRGWVEPGQVLNTRPVDEVLTFIAAKRRR